jgi:branched-chain amino acid transport system substrate-binding protein
VWRIISCLVVGLAALSAFGLPWSAQGEAITIKIVSSLPKVGRAAAEVEAMQRAVQMAVDGAGEVGGVVFQYQPLDDSNPGEGSWDAHREANNARQAVADPSVMAYIGPFDSGAAATSIAILNRAHLVMISPSAAYPGLTRASAGTLPDEPSRYYPAGLRNFARVIPLTDAQGAIAATWAEAIGARRVFVVDDGERPGQALAVAFTRNAAQLGLQVVGGPLSIDPRAADYYGLVTQIGQQDPDLVYFGGGSQAHAGLLLKELRAAVGPGPKFMGADGLYNQAFIDDADRAAEGAYVTAGAVPPGLLSGRGADWYQAYLARYGSPPGIYSAYAYQAAQVVIDAVRRVGRVDREAIRAAVLATRDFDGVLGRFSFDEAGDTNWVVMSGRRVKNGKFDEDGAVVLSLPAPPRGS